MGKVWVLKMDDSSDLEAFGTEDQGLAAYREHIEERTSGMDWYDKNFEWHDETYPDGTRHRICFCYGDFVASLDELTIKFEGD